MEQQMVDRITVPVEKGMKFLRLIDIIYLKRYGKKTLIYTREGDAHIAEKAFEDYEMLLTQSSFISVNSVFLIRKDQINTYNSISKRPAISIMDEKFNNSTRAFK